MVEVETLSKQQEENKKKIIEFYNEVMLKGDAKTAEKLMTKDYIQHNPQAGDGRDSLLEHVNDLKNEFPNRTVDFKHLFADGDFVITHILFQMNPDDLGIVGMDIFRFEGEKIAEHWDVIQKIPENSLNSNTLF
ncbi:nuclear transport factor 2 family protein [Enterococcus sp. LJL120]